jgi:hypothetical protein
MAVDFGLNLVLGDVVKIRHVERRTDKEVLIDLRRHERRNVGIPAIAFN